MSEPADGGAAEAWRRLRAARGFVFDMDGVLYRGEQALGGVAEALAAIAVRDGRFMLATNNSMSTPASYVGKLGRMGIEVPEESILTAGLATRDHLIETLEPGAGIFVVGMPALREQLFEGSSFHPVQYGEEQPAAVVVGLDLSFDYAKLKAATEAIRAGARFVATNADATLPTEGGLVPGAGSIVAAVSVASGREPTVIGKPETPLLVQSLHRMDVPPADAVMIGDRLDTDILAGQRAGMLTVLVLTGVSTRDEIATAPVPPDIVLTDLTALVAALTAEA
ncbi:MAG: HAD-IIA family hydrolase [Chloroflexota bacterium]|nr:HAD-IIA family hydrolase [Chloroflexota bacterium]